MLYQHRKILFHSYTWISTAFIFKMCLQFIAKHEVCVHFYSTFIELISWYLWRVLPGIQKVWFLKHCETLWTKTWKVTCCTSFHQIWLLRVSPIKLLLCLSNCLCCGNIPIYFWFDTANGAILFSSFFCNWCLFYSLESCPTTFLIFVFCISVRHSFI